MKTHTTTSAALILFTRSVLAADLQPDPVISEPVLPMWSGFYLGLNAGGAWGSNRAVSLNSSPFWASPDNPLPNPSKPIDYAQTAAIGATGALGGGNSGTFIGGGQIGYNRQVSSALVAGVEADIQGLTRGSGSSALVTALPIIGPNTLNQSFATTFSAQKTIKYLGTLRGRIGYLVTPTLLVYGAGGLAFGGVNLNASGTQTLLHAVSTVTGPGGNSLSETKVGWTAGGGVEWMFAPNWSAKAEYLYYDLGSMRRTVGITTSVLNRGGVDDGLKWLNATQASSRFSGNLISFGINYHFAYDASRP